MPRLPGLQTVGGGGGLGGQLASVLATRAANGAQGNNLADILKAAQTGQPAPLATSTGLTGDQLKQLLASMGMKG